jgi:hypothetical protein
MAERRKFISSDRGPRQEKEASSIEHGLIGGGGVEIEPGFLHFASRRVRSERTRKEKASARFGRNDTNF